MRLAPLAATCLAATVAACKGAPPPPEPPPKPIIASLTIIGSADLNPNRAGRASPVFLRLYQLRDGARFMNAAFDDLTARADQVLAAALVSREERMVEPGSTVTLTLQVPPDTRLLGVIAEYADLAGSQWRAASPEPPGGLLTLFKDHSLLVTVGRQAVVVTAVPAPPSAPAPAPAKAR